MSLDVSSSRAAARALGARNPIAFDCVHPVAECVRRLGPLATGRAAVTGEAVRLVHGAVRFEGRWTSGGKRLEGTMVPHGGRVVLAVFYAVVVLLVLAGVKAGIDSRWEGGAGWIFAIPALMVAVGLPLLVIGLGSARVAAEIELSRAIGQAVGDPEKYAARWRRFNEG